MIEKLQFRSCGKYLLKSKAISELPKDIAWSLTEKERILIPFLDPDNELYHLRPHKRGFKNFGHHPPYIPYQLLPEDTSTLVIAESEFKAIASCLMGVPAIGIYGISSYSKNHLVELMDVLKGLGCKKAIICFDNEIKDDPQFENYKPNFTKRYDTLIYEYIMAYSISKEGIECKVARLKDEWRVNGKVDIDGALAQKVSHQEYQELIANAVTDSEYRKSWQINPAHKSYIARRIDKHFYNGPINADFNSYFHKNRKLTNFTIKIAYTIKNDGKAERFCKFESKYGHSENAILRPEVMTSKGSFQKFCYELGDYEFYGKDVDLPDLWHYAFLHQDGTMIRKLKYYGYDDETKIWFFANGAYFNDKFHEVSDENIVWVDDMGFMLPEKLEGLDSPALNKDEFHLSISHVYQNLSKIINEQYAKLIIGWTLGNFFMPEILDTWKVYPFLFFFGKQQGGKSTLSNWISQFFGFTQKGFPFSSSSVAGISRCTSQLSMVPVWIEEYRSGDPSFVSKNNLLRSIFDKSTSVKGTKRPDEIKGYKARSTLIISGEEAPRDSALNSRCVIIPVYRANYNDHHGEYEWMNSSATIFNTIGHKILTNKKYYWERIKERTEGYLEAFKEQIENSDNRSRLFMGTLAGVCDTFLGEDEGFTQFVGKQTMEKTLSTDAAQALYVFFDDIANQWGTGKINFDFFKKSTDAGKTEVAFWFAGCYSHWEQSLKGLRNDIPAAKTALIEHLKTEKYYLETKNVKIKGKSLFCCILDYDNPIFPRALKNIVDSQMEFMPYGQETEDQNDQSVERPKLVFGHKT